MKPELCGILIYLLIIALLFIFVGIPSANQHVEEGSAGFLKGLWHGFTLSISCILRILFPSKFGIYEVLNNGGWYDFGFIFGISIAFGGYKYSAKK